MELMDINELINWYGDDKYEEVIDYVNKNVDILQGDSQKSDYYSIRGTCYFELSKLEEAGKDFKKSIDLDPDFSVNYHNLSELLFRLKNYEDAIKNSNHAIMLDNSNHLFYYSLAKSYFAKKEYKLAIDNYTIAMNLNKNKDYNSNISNDNYNYRIGNCYLKLDDFSKAIDYFNKAISLNETKDVYYYSLAFCYGNINKDGDAITNYNKAISINDKNDYYYYALASIYNKIGEYNKSIGICFNIIDKTSREEDFYYILGNSYMKNDPTSAIEYYIASFNLNPNTLKNTDKILYFIISNIKEKNITGNLGEFILLLYIQIFLLKKYLNVKKNNEINTVSQYTNINAIHKMFYKENDNNKLNFRMYNSIYMNDPQEGNIFNKILKTDDTLSEFIDELYPKNQFKLSNVYLTSFSMNSGEHLPMWSNYGNKTNGCKINVKTSCFDYFNFNDLNIYLDDDNKDEKVENLNNSLIKKFNLFNVIYYKKDENNNYKFSYNQPQEHLNDVEKHINKIKEILLNISKELNNTTKEQKEFVLTTTRDLLDQIRFLFKDDIWAYEEEVRVVSFQDSKEKIKLDVVNETSRVPKLFIELDKEIPYNEVTVTLGSNVAKPNEVAQYLYHVGVKDVKMSEIEYN